MFGLEEQKKKKAKEFEFDLELDFKNAKRHQEIKKRVEQQIQRIKEVLRSGESKDEFDQFGIVLHGYASLLKVMSRIAKK